MLDALDGGQALFFRQLSDRVGSTDDPALVAALWDLVWAGHLTNDTLAPLRALLGAPGGRRPARRAARAPLAGTGGRGRPAMPTRTGPPTAAGRWSRLPAREADPTRRAHALAEVLLDRHGVVTRGAVVAERVPGGFAAVYPVLKALEETGRRRRGYFVEALGAAQFALPGAVDRLRAYAADRRSRRRAGAGGPAARRAARAGARRDRPGQPVRRGAALAGPRRRRRRPRGHRPGRKAGALVVLVDGELALYVERGGRTLLSLTDDPTALQPAADALALAVRDGGLGRLAVERADGESVHASSALADALEAAGFRPTPRGLRLRA